MLFPIPKKITYKEGNFEGNLDTINLGKFRSLLIIPLQKLFPNITENIHATINIFIKNLPYDGFSLDILKNTINIGASSPSGAFYALEALKQLSEEKNPIPCVEIEDYPDLLLRGVLVDISRSKVPNIDTLKEMIDFFSRLRFNHLELYVEGFSYEYKSFKELLVNNNYLTVNEYIELESYAKAFFIDLVPNQNGFGHMTEWLKVPKFKNLAINEDGFYVWGSKYIPSTVNPLDNESVNLVKKMYDDMLPYSKSNYFNMNFDEPHELGIGKTKEACERTSKEDVFINYFLKLYDHVKSYHKTPLIWADVICGNFDCIKRLPKDVYLVDWGYGKNYPFDKDGEKLSKFDNPFVFAPGTSTWCTILGRFDDMLCSIKNACKAAIKYKAKGIIVTDWGDFGHLQYLPVSYPGFTLASALAWNYEGVINEEELLNMTEKEINDEIGEKLMDLLGYLIHDNDAADIMVELSKYTRLEGDYRDYGSRLMSPILWANNSQTADDALSFFLEKMSNNLIDKENITKLNDLFIHYLSKLDLIKSDMIKDELTNSINLLQILLSINIKLGFYIKCNIQQNFREEITALRKFSEVHQRLWNLRNKCDGYKLSNAYVLQLESLLIKIDGKEQL